jgi:hypothetical protein
MICSSERRERGELKMDGPQTFMVLFFGLGIYFMPWLIAIERGHHNATAIFMLDLLLGWTLLGWVIAMVWSCTTVDFSKGRRFKRAPFSGEPWSAKRH